MCLIRSNLQLGTAALGGLGEGILGREVSRRLEVSHAIVQHLQECFRAMGSAKGQVRLGHP